ncbi:MAG: hypothetical protein OXM87_11610 [Truepera sp.]|nr:hypothetical protein [Truepera sp.]
MTGSPLAGGAFPPRPLEDFGSRLPGARRGPAATGAVAEFGGYIEPWAVHGANLNGAHAFDLSRQTRTFLDDIRERTSPSATGADSRASAPLSLAVAASLAMAASLAIGSGVVDLSTTGWGT